MAPHMQHRLLPYSLLLAALLSACAAPTPGSRPVVPGPPVASAPAVYPALPSAPAPAQLSLAGTSWVAIAVDGVPEVVNPKPKLRWTAPDRIAGTGGCNGFAGRSTTAGQDDLHIGPMDSTGRACLSMPGSQEDKFFKALETTSKARIERDQLVLLDEHGKQLVRFVKAN